MQKWGELQLCESDGTNLPRAPAVRSSARLCGCLPAAGLQPWSCPPTSPQQRVAGQQGWRGHQHFFRRGKNLKMLIITLSLSGLLQLLSSAIKSSAAATKLNISEYNPKIGDFRGKLSDFLISKTTGACLYALKLCVFSSCSFRVNRLWPCHKSMSAKCF